MDKLNLQTKEAFQDNPKVPANKKLSATEINNIGLKIDQLVEEKVDIEPNKRLMTGAEGVKLAELNNQVLVTAYKNFLYMSGPQTFVLDHIPFNVHPITIYDNEDAPTPHVVPILQPNSPVIAIDDVIPMRENDRFTVTYTYAVYANLTAPQSFRSTIKVDTYADALNHAIGAGFKELIVASDETDNGKTNSYNYNGSEGELDLIF